MYIYVVYKVLPAKLRSHGTCRHVPVFACSIEWIAVLVGRFVRPSVVYCDPGLRVFPEHVEDDEFETVVKNGKTMLRRLKLTS